MFLELVSCSFYSNIPSNSGENKIYNYDHISSWSFFSEAWICGVLWLFRTWDLANLCRFLRVNSGTHFKGVLKIASSKWNPKMFLYRIKNPQLCHKKLLSRRDFLKICVLCALLYSSSNMSRIAHEWIQRCVTSSVSWFRLYLQEWNEVVKQGKSRRHLLSQLCTILDGFLLFPSMSKMEKVLFLGVFSESS